MSSRAERRIRLYDLYEKNLSHYIDGVKRFVCPICTKAFSREAVLPDSLQVDLAHCYPESCGGKLETLTCKKCNGDIGGTYDTHLAKEHQIHRAFDPKHVAR